MGSSDVYPGRCATEKGTRILPGAVGSCCKSIKVESNQDGQEQEEDKQDKQPFYHTAQECFLVSLGHKPYTARTKGAAERQYLFIRASLRYSPA